MNLKLGEKMENINELENLEQVEKELTSKDNSENSNSSNSEKQDDDSKDKNITITSTQHEILKEITRVDLEIEKLQTSDVNEDEFYEKLDELLTDEEKYLQEENPKAYLKLVDTKKKEFFKNNSNEDKIKELSEKKKELELKNAIESGVVEVTKIYKDYNHEEMGLFYKNKLNKEEQEEIINSSTSMVDVFKKTYEKFLEKNGKVTEVKNKPAPNTPDLSIVNKQPIRQNEINMIDSEDEKYKKALGV